MFHRHVLNWTRSRPNPAEADAASPAEPILPLLLRAMVISRWRAEDGPEETLKPVDGPAP